jgi:hypothetical protein
MELTLRAYCSNRRIPYSPGVRHLPAFQEYLEKEKGARGLDLSTPRTRKERFFDNLTQLAPDWRRRLAMGQTRMKTFLRIYVSKWFYRGLDWNERELVILLAKRFKHPGLDWLTTSEGINRKGYFFLSELFMESEQLGPELAADELDGPSELFELIYPEADFLAIWKLRSFQSLKDFLFVKVTGHEHEGKLGIKKPRIRGYRDGKSSPKDPTLIKMALEVDVMFYTEEQEKRWNDLEDEINSMVPGH